MMNIDLLHSAGMYVVFGRSVILCYTNESVMTDLNDQLVFLITLAAAPARVHDLRTRISKLFSHESTLTLT